MNVLKYLGWVTLYAFAIGFISSGVNLDSFWISIIGSLLLGFWLCWTWIVINKPKGDQYSVYFTGLSKEELDRAREYVERNIERNSRRSNPAHRKGAERISEERTSGSPYQSESGSEV